MGSIVSGLFGGGGSGGAGVRGGEAEAAANREAIEEIRRQFDVTQEQFAPFVAAGTEALPGVVQGTTAGGLSERLSEIFGTDIFQNIVGERTKAIQGQLAASGLTRSGTALQEIAKIPIQTGLGIEDLLTSRLTGLAGSGQAAVARLGGLGAQASGGIANLLSDIGRAKSQGGIIDQQARAAQQQSSQQFIGQLATAGAIFFSDPKLKENIEPIGEIGDLILYQWDWIDRLEDSFVSKMGTIGFMADEVKKKYPQFVQEVWGFDAIDYSSLLNTLEMEVS